MKRNTALISQLEAVKKSLLVIQTAAAQLTVVDRPIDVPMDFYDRVRRMCVALQDFCALQNTIINALEKRI